MYLTGDGWTTWVAQPNESYDPLMHWVFTNTMAGNTAFRLNLTTASQWGGCPGGDLCMLPEGDGGAQWWDESASPPWTSDASDDFMQYIDTWTCFEYKMEISGSSVILTEWVDGVLTRGPVTGPGQEASGVFDYVYFHLYDNQSTTHVLEYYIDDIVVADQYIGTLGATTTTTTATATGLSITGGRF